MSIQGHQLVIENTAPNLALAARSDLNSYASAINSEAGAPARISATFPTPDAKLNFSQNEVSAGDGAGKSGTAIKGNIPTVPASTWIDFQLQTTNGATFSVSWPASTVGYFRRCGFTLLSDGTIQVLFTAEAATLGATANAGTVFVKSGLPLGWVDLVCTDVAGKFKTSGSGTNIIQNSVSGTSTIHRFGAGGGGAASGSGSGVGDDINVLQFKASFTDPFEDTPGTSDSAVDYTTGKTDPLTYSAVASYHRLNYDASKTVTGTGTAMTMSVAPAYTVKIGDLLIVGTEVRRIETVTTQTAYVINAAFSVDPVSSVCCVSQAVYTKDVNNFAGDGLAIASAFSTTISQCTITYEDSLAVGDTIFDNTNPALIGFQASSDGTSYTGKLARVGNITDTAAIVNLPSSGTNMYLRFFANATSGSGACNILGYKAFFHKDTSLVPDGGILNQAYCFTDGTGTAINCATPTVVGGKTRVTLTWTYPVGLNSGTTNGALEIHLDGKKIPRYIDATLTPDAYYKEITANIIELDTDYSGFNYDIDVVKPIAIVDVSTDNSTNISYIQQAQVKGFQGFVDESNQLTSTSTAYYPNAAPTGKFYSTIIGRAPITDLGQDLKSRIGIERIMTQQIYEIQNEFGPNGEKVFGALNDDKGLFRFAGEWTTINSNYGSYICPTAAGGYLEITAYCTGLNILMAIVNSPDLRVSVDGGAEGSNFFPASGSTVLGGRNYAENCVLSCSSGLSVGLHTFKIRVAATTPVIHGFEILNESSSIKTTPGTVYLGGKKLVSSSLVSSIYNSGFTNVYGSVGTKGGHILKYLDPTGTPRQDIRYTEAAAGYYIAGGGSNADHTNEEVIRVYYPREFGAGRYNATYANEDDFSLMNSTPRNASFTLDDGVTTLSAKNNSMYIANSSDILYLGGTTGNYYLFTFVGTGLDITWTTDGGGTNSNANAHTVTVDGGTAINWTVTSIGSNFQVAKICSGLPFGTHVVKIMENAVSAWNLLTKNFIVYGPKKPVLPSGCVELGDTFLMADFVANTVAGQETISTGILRKSSTREQVYVGTWSISLNTANIGFFQTNTTTTSDYFEYTFFGTGIDYRFSTPGTTLNVTMSIDGSTNLSAYTTSYYGAGITSFTASTGVIAISASGAVGNGARVSGLTLGLHKVRVTRTSGTGTMVLEVLDIITPLYSSKSNFQADIQNTLTVGSNSISDNRKLSPVKEIVSTQKYRGIARGIAQGTTSVATFVPIPDMSLTVKSNGSWFKLTSMMTTQTPAAAIFPCFNYFVDGIAYGPEFIQYYNVAGQEQISTIIDMVYLSPGVHKIDLYGRTGVAGNAITYTTFRRTLIVEEI